MWNNYVISMILGKHASAILAHELSDKFTLGSRAIWLAELKLSFISVKLAILSYLWHNLLLINGLDIFSSV